MTDLDVGVITDSKIKEWENKFDKKDDGFHCKKCDSVIQQTTCRASIHYKPAGCFNYLGFGEVECLPYPYCPKCDEHIENVSGVIYRHL